MHVQAVPYELERNHILPEWIIFLRDQPHLPLNFLELRMHLEVV